MHRFGMMYVNCFCLSSSTYPYSFRLLQHTDFEKLGVALAEISGQIIQEYHKANIPHDHKAESFYSYLHNPVPGAVTYDINNVQASASANTGTKLVPVGYYTHLASIRS